MKTKEIILKDSLLSINNRNIKKNVGDRWAQFNAEESTIAIYNAMEEYAKQEAENFGIWLNKNCECPVTLPPPEWYYYNGARQRKTTEELFQLYKQQKQT